MAATAALQRPRLRRRLAIAVTLAAGSLVSAAEPPQFSRDILPIFSDHCFACHGPDEGARKAHLRLDTPEGARNVGKSGVAAIVPGQGARSELVRRITSTDPEEVMPPPKAKRPLTPAQIELLGRWIDSGAEWGRHWAYESPRHQPPPPCESPADNPIDRFIRARLDREGWSLSPEAPPETLVRRVTLDLTGLPPTPAEIDAYLADDQPGAFERVVDRLLTSPHYGERMAWEWLEASRYADSNGYQGDAERTMWPWRDWVVDAFNRGLPFDEFTTWQLAGDLLPEATFEQRLATGFLRNHAINGEGGRIPEENRIDYLLDQTETVGTVWLGATLSCTRCHNHKFDPLTQRDYYGLLAFFNRTAIDGSGGDPQSAPNLAVPTPEQLERQGEAEKRFDLTTEATDRYEASKFPRAGNQSAGESNAANGLPEEVLGHLKVSLRKRDASRLEKLAAYWKSSDPEYATLLEEQRQALNQLNAANRAIPRVMVMADVPKPRDTFILTRGLYTQPGAQVTAALPSSIGPASTCSNTPPNRLSLARWLVAPDHPLTARVTVNRLWQSHFGTGLVKTAEDFGVQGERPSHPELLDWLASEFVASGWNVKSLQRLIVTSRTYRQSSRVTPAAWERDPGNRLLARGPRLRLPSWMIRDCALAASGLLSEELGGPPVRPYQPSGVWEEATFGNKRYQPDHGASLYRRSVYVFWRRIVGPTMFFDVASRQTCTVRTPRTNVPLHALLTLNDVGYLEAARALARRVLHSDADTHARLDRAGRLVLGRRLTADEHRILEAGLTRHCQTYMANAGAARRLLANGELPPDPALDPVEHAAWTMVCNTVLNLDEAITRE